MSIEKDYITFIANTFKKSNNQLNKLFECDCEILQFGNEKIFLNIDEFSSEDMIRENDPYILGWNIAVGGISDVLASGGIPVFYAHNLVIDKNWDEEYIKSFSKGIRDVLELGNISFVGGDFGISEEWRCAPVVIGKGEGALLRSGAMRGDKIYITGKIGAGNLEAVMKLYCEDKRLKNIISNIKNKFKTRFEEASLIRKYSKCCIDTSDGLLNGLNSISNMSSKGYKIENIPYSKTAVIASKLISLPKTLLMMGECGEYELLFTIENNKEQDFLKEAAEKNIIFYKLGEITEELNKIVIEKNEKYDFKNINISARDYINKKEYIKYMVKELNESKVKHE